MSDFIIKVLITTLTVAAIGYATNNLVMNNLRLRRKANRRQTELMIEYANIYNGKDGIYKELVI